MKGKKKKQTKNTFSIKNNKCILYIVMIFLVLILISLCVAFSYAFWVSSFSQTKQNKIEAGCLSFTYNDKDVDGNVTSINMSNAYPMSDDSGVDTEPYVFTLKNTCTLDITFNIYINTLSTSTLDSKYIKYNLSDLNKSFNVGPLVVGDLKNSIIEEEMKSEIVEKVGEFNSSYLIHTLDLNAGDEVTLYLNLWIDYTAPNSIMGQTYNSALSVISTVSE